MDTLEIRQARGLDRLVVLDVETGGLDPNEHSILSVALVDMETGARIAFLVREVYVVTTPRAMEVNRLDLEKVTQEGLSPWDATREIAGFLQKLREAEPGRRLMILGHNVAFDLGFLRRMYSQAGAGIEREFTGRCVDTGSLLHLLIERSQWEPDKNYLDAAIEYFDVKIEEKDRHTALGDCLATIEVYKGLMGLLTPPRP